MAEPPLDIQELFRHYNFLYFDDALGACIVSWAPRMRSSVGTCRYIKAGHCEIRLSEPLLKLLPSSDLKNSLLHEMVHAFLWIKEKNKERSKHGADFWAMANEINSSCKVDEQKPSNGYSISDQHKLHDEAETSAVHQGKCEPCGHSTNREISRGPSPGGCVEKTSNLSCEWHRHKKLCPGRYNKVNISSFRGKQNVVEAVQENDGCKHAYSSHATRRARRTQPAEERKDNNRRKKLTNFFSSASDKTKSSENILKYQRITCKKKCNGSNNERNESYKRKREVSLNIPWLGVYTDEESEEEKEPLINKRSVRRTKLKESVERSGQIGLTFEEVIYVE